jgi:hypothetical protein
MPLFTELPRRRVLGNRHPRSRIKLHPPVL